MTLTPIHPELTTGLQTLLTYVIQPYPSPLTAMAPQAPTNSPIELPPQSLVFLITNQSGNTVSIDEIQISIPTGSTSSELTNYADLIVPTFDGGATSMVLQPVTDSNPIVFTISGATHGGVSIANNDSMMLQLAGIVTNIASGTVTVDITETSSSGQVPVAFPVPIFPFAFYFANLLAYDAQSGLPTAQIDSGQSVTLQWDTSVGELPNTTFTVYYSTQSGPASSNEWPAQPVTEFDNWTSPSLTSDTVFTVVAAISQLQGPDLYLSLSTSVAVTDPDITVNDLTVNGTLTVDGPEVTFNDLILNGTLTVDGSASIQGAATLSGGVTMTAGTVSALQGAQTLLADTLISGNLFYNTYVAGTDGFVIGSVSPPPGWFDNPWPTDAMLTGWMQAANSTGANAYATGGVLLSSPSWAAGVQDSLTLPICNGEQFTIWQNYFTEGGQSPPLMYWWFIPSGTGSVGSPGQFTQLEAVAACTLVTDSDTAAAAAKTRIGERARRAPAKE